MTSHPGMIAWNVGRKRCTTTSVRISAAESMCYFPERSVASLCVKPTHKRSVAPHCGDTGNYNQHLSHTMHITASRTGLSVDAVEQISVVCFSIYLWASPMGGKANIRGFGSFVVIVNIMFRRGSCFVSCHVSARQGDSVTDL